MIKKKSFESIGHWAYQYFYDNIGNVDKNFEDLILAIGAMEDGPEFYFTHKELNKIINNLLKDKD